MYDHILGDVHHALIVGVCLIQLDGGELRVVAGVHALVAEDTADLVDLLEAADDQTLEVQLGCNTHVHVDVQRIVMGDERTCCRTARDGVEAGRLNFHKAAAIHEAADLAHDCRALLEGVTYLGVDDEVNVTLTVAHIGVLQTVPLLGQRNEVLGQQSQLGDLDRDLTLLGAEYLAGDADEVADVHLLKALVNVLAQCVTGDVQLETAIAVGQVCKGCLAHDALGHHTASQTDGLTLHLFEAILDIGGEIGAVKAYLLKGVCTSFLKLAQLIAADAQQFVELCLRRLGCRRVLLFVCHVRSFPFSVLLDDFDDLILDGAGRCLDLNDLTNLLTQYSLAERRLVRNLAVHRVSFLRADKVVLLHLAELYVLYLETAAGGNLVLTVHIIGDDNSVSNDILDLSDTRIELALLVLCLIVLRVLGQVTKRACFLDLLGDLLLTDGFEIFQFFLELIQAFLRQFKFLRHVTNPSL